MASPLSTNLGLISVQNISLHVNVLRDKIIYNFFNVMEFHFLKILTKNGIMLTCECPSVSKDKFLCLLGMLTVTSSLLRKRIFWELLELELGFLRVDLGVGTGLRLMLRGEPGVVDEVSLSVSDIFIRITKTFRSCLFLHKRNKLEVIWDYCHWYWYFCYMSMHFGRIWDYILHFLFIVSFPNLSDHFLTKLIDCPPNWNWGVLSLLLKHNLFVFSFFLIVNSFFLGCNQSILQQFSCCWCLLGLSAKLRLCEM
jgi:hypothetical protein